MLKLIRYFVPVAVADLKSQVQALQQKNDSLRNFAESPLSFNPHPTKTRTVTPDESLGFNDWSTHIAKSVMECYESR